MCSVEVWSVGLHTCVPEHYLFCIVGIVPTYHKHRLCIPLASSLHIAGIVSTNSWHRVQCRGLAFPKDKGIKSLGSCAAQNDLHSRSVGAYLYSPLLHVPCFDVSTGRLPSVWLWLIEFSRVTAHRVEIWHGYFCPWIYRS